METIYQRLALIPTVTSGLLRIEYVSPDELMYR